MKPTGNIHSVKFSNLILLKPFATTALEAGLLQALGQLAGVQGGAWWTVSQPSHRRAGREPFFTSGVHQIV